jgi:hypothetical protein
MILVAHVADFWGAACALHKRGRVNPGDSRYTAFWKNAFSNVG